MADQLKVEYHTPSYSVVADDADIVARDGTSSGNGSVREFHEEAVYLSPQVGTRSGTRIRGYDGRQSFLANQSGAPAQITYHNPNDGSDYEVTMTYQKDFLLGSTVMFPYITQRKLPSGEWETPIELKAISENPSLESRYFGVMAKDNHNTIAISIDKNGYFWACGNMHDDPLTLARSTDPYDLTTWESVPLPIVDPAPEEDNIEYGGTYPYFIKLSNGDMFLFIRLNEGGVVNPTSVNSREYLFQYDADTETWSNPLGSPTTPLFDGVAPNPNLDPSPEQDRGFYFIAVPYVDDDDRVHLVYSWRFKFASDMVESYAFTPNEQIEYIVSKSGDLSQWSKANGDDVPVPIKELDGDTVIMSPVYDGTNEAEANWGITHFASGLTVDSSNRPHFITSLYDDTKTFWQARHCYWNGSEWIVNHLEGARWTGDVPFRTPLIVSDRYGRIYGIDARNKIEVVNMNPLEAGYSEQSWPLVDMEISGLDIGVDPTSKKLRDEIAFNLHQTSADSNDWNFMDQYQAVMRMRMDQFSAVRRRDAPIPRLRKIAIFQGPKTDQVVTSTSFVDLMDYGPSENGILYTNIDQILAHGDRLFFRLMVRGSIQNPTTDCLQVCVRSLFSFFSARPVMVNERSNAGLIAQQTPWVPSGQLFGPSTEPASITVQARAATDEIQTIDLGGATSGVWNLQDPIFGVQTVNLTRDVTAAILQERFGRLPFIGRNIAVTGEPGGPYVVRYVGQWSAQDVLPPVIGGTLAGGVPATVTETQKGGQAGGEGYLPVNSVTVELAVLEGDRTIAL